MQNDHVSPIVSKVSSSILWPMNYRMVRNTSRALRKASCYISWSGWWLHTCVYLVKIHWAVHLWFVHCLYVCYSSISKVYKGNKKACHLIHPSSNMEPHIVFQSPRVIETAEPGEGGHEAMSYQWKGPTTPFQLPQGHVYCHSFEV